MSSYYEKMLATGEVKCIDEEVPFEIPQGWEWCRMQDVITFVNGRAYKKEELLPQGKYKVLRVGNFFTNNEWYYSDLELPEDKYCYNGDLLYAWSASFGHQIWNGDKTIFHYHIWNIKFNSMILFREYLYYFFLFDKTQVKASTTGSTMVHVSMENMKPRLIPIPPVNEQKRIVHEIENIIPLIERYGTFQNKKEILDSNIKTTLKKSILQEAIQGKLVPQIAEEGTAQELLEQIKAEKQKLVKEGKLKKSALNDSVIFRGDHNKYYEQIGRKCLDITEQIPFEIPSNWEWCRVRNVSNSYIGLTYKPTDIDKNGTIVLRSCNIRNGKLALDDIVRVSSSISEKLLIEENDIIICARNGSKRLVGKSALIRNLTEPMTFGAFMAICKTPIYEYMFAYLQSDLFFGQLRDVSNTTTINQLTQNKFNDFLIPIPPVKEQERIAFKISQLFQELR